MKAGISVLAMSLPTSAAAVACTVKAWVLVRFITLLSPCAAGRKQLL